MPHVPVAVADARVASPATVAVTECCPTVRNCGVLIRQSPSVNVVVRPTSVPSMLSTISRPFVPASEVIRPSTGVTTPYGRPADVNVSSTGALTAAVNVCATDGCRAAPPANAASTATLPNVDGVNVVVATPDTSVNEVVVTPPIVNAIG